jgi:hypothetical protein
MTSIAVAGIIGGALLLAVATIGIAAAYASVVALAWTVRVVGGMIEAGVRSVAGHVRDRRGFDTKMRERLGGMVEGAGRGEG